MDLFRWTAGLEIGVPEIDRQHVHLMHLMNRLHDIVAAGRGRDMLAAVLEELERFAEHHFATEERLLDEYAVAGAEAHKGEHRMMLDDLHRYCDDCILGAGNPKVVLGYLEHWFARHIDNADRALGRAIAGCR